MSERIKRNLVIYDSTLRDGTQGEGFNLSVEDRIRIALKLDEFGVDFIEGGWPGAVPVATEFFQEIKNYKFKNSVLAAFGMTRKFSNPAENDENLLDLLKADVPAITIFGKTWDIHVEEVLKITLENNLQIIQDSLKFLKPNVDYLFYDAEHFFDGFKKNPEYAIKTLESAVVGGADCLILCDTNGGTLFFEITEIVQRVKKHFGNSVELGIHAHNDSEIAVANSVEAVRNGVTQIQGTFNGVGERCGNANLASLIPILSLKMGYDLLVSNNLTKLTEVSRFVSEIANLQHNRHQPFTGSSAFAHKGGIHVSAVMKNPVTYEHVNPLKVGNARRIVLSDQSGAANVLYKAKEFGLPLNSDDPLVKSLVKELKDLENSGFQFEGADASFELLIRKTIGLHRNYFKLISFKVIKQNDKFDPENSAEATVKIAVGGEEIHTAASGNGPVNALDKALRKALSHFYPAIKEMELVDYKVRVLRANGKRGTEAKVRVLIESTDYKSSWGTVGVSADLVDASWQALVDSFTYKLIKNDKEKYKEK